jgi:hypothetical protein
VISASRPARSILCLRRTALASKPADTLPSINLAACLPPPARASTHALAITLDREPPALLSTRIIPRRAVRRGAASPSAERPSSCLVREAISHYRLAHRRAVMVAKRRGAVHRNTVGWPSARPLGLVAQELRMPAVPSSPRPRPRPASRVRCPVQASTPARPRDRRPVSGAGVCASSCPASGVQRGASGVRAFPRPLCPTGVRSWKAAVGRAAAWLGWPGSAWSPAVSTTGSLTARTGTWRPRLAPAVRGQRRRRLGLGRRRGRWLGNGQLDRVADQDRPDAREVARW